MILAQLMRFPLTGRIYWEKTCLNIHCDWICFPKYCFNSEILCISQIEASTSHPRAYPGHLTSFPARERGNLINLVFPGGGHLITTHWGWGNLIASLNFMSRVALIPWGVINHGEDKPSFIQSERYPIRGGLAEKQRLAQALFCIWRYSRTICIIFGM